MSDHDGFEQHDHPALAHNHGHYHVTHNFNEASGGFVHLSSRHEHEHDHSALNHAHYPHENFDKEHEGEVSPARQLPSPCGRESLTGTCQQSSPLMMRSASGGPQEPGS